MRKADKRSEEILDAEGFNWKDIAIFLTDEHLRTMLEDMQDQGAIGESNADDMYDLQEYVTRKIRAAIGRPE